MERLMTTAEAMIVLRDANLEFCNALQTTDPLRIATARRNFLLAQAELRKAKSTDAAVVFDHQQ